MSENTMSVRRKGRIAAVASLLCLPLVMSACGSDDGGDVGESAGSTACAASFDASLVKAAQKEGKVTLYAGGHTPESAELAKTSFNDCFGIDVEYSRQPASNIVSIVEAARKGGQKEGDVVSLPDLATFLRWSKEGVTVTSDVPNLDDVLDGFDNPDSADVPFTWYPAGIAYNTDKTDPPEGTWKEIIASAKGPVLVVDPGSSGTALNFANFMMKEAPGFAETLGKQELLSTASTTDVVQMVVLGEADLGIPALESLIFPAKTDGEPIDIVYPEPFIPTSVSTLAALADAPHPNAAELLVQWHLSMPYQNAMAAIGLRSVLKDGDQPKGGADLSSRNLLPPEVKNPIDKDAVVAKWSSLVK